MHIKTRLPPHTVHRHLGALKGRRRRGGDMEEGAGAMALWQFMNEMALDNIVLEGAFLAGSEMLCN